MVLRGDNMQPTAIKISRRTALGLLVSSLFFWLSRIRAQDRKAETPIFARVSALADTIVPRDDFPGAVDAHVPQRLISSFSEDKGKRAIYVRGLELLDELAISGHGETFADLAVDTREQILHSLTKKDAFSRHFQYLAVKEVLTFYYSSSAGQQMLAYTPPAQGYDPQSPFCA